MIKCFRARKPRLCEPCGTGVTPVVIPAARRLSTAAVCALAFALFQPPALACSVCYGDPQSSMVQGAVMGVLVLVVIVGSVLAGIAGIGIVWLQRSRKFAAQHPEYFLENA